MDTHVVPGIHDLGDDKSTEYRRWTTAGRAARAGTSLLRSVYGRLEDQVGRRDGDLVGDEDRPRVIVVG